MALAIHPIHRLMPFGRPGPGVAALAMLPFRLIARVLFVDVKLKREGKNLHIVLAVKPPVLPKPSPSKKAIAEAAPLRQALKALLDQHPLTRQLMRHLGYLDRALARQGLKALAEVPVEVLATSLQQLEAIVDNWSDRHLADLRSRLAVAVKERSEDGFGNQRSDFATASRLLVDDVAHSEFMALERQYEGLVTPETIQAALEAIRTPPPVEPAATTVTLINEVVMEASPPSPQPERTAIEAGLQAGRSSPPQGPHQDHRMQRPAAAPDRGFTLIEVMIVVAILAILAGVAMPQYKDYLTRSRLADAATGLATMRAQMERYYQDNRTYANSGRFVPPCNSGSDASRTFGNFVISCADKLSATEFRLRATGNGPVSEFAYTINQLEVRATERLPKAWGKACDSKWIMKKGDSC